MKCFKARIHYEIFLSDYFMRYSLMHISLHIIWFHEIHVKCVKRNPSRTIISKCSICLEHIFSKNTAKQKRKRKKGVRVKSWLKNRRYTSALNNITTIIRSRWLMRLKNQYCFVLLYISCLTLFFMGESKFYPPKIFLLILKNFQWTKFSFEGFLKISGQ